MDRKLTSEQRCKLIAERNKERKLCAEQRRRDKIDKQKQKRKDLLDATTINFSKFGVDTPMCLYNIYSAVPEFFEFVPSDDPHISPSLLELFKTKRSLEHFSRLFEFINNFNSHRDQYVNALTCFKKSPIRHGYVDSIDTPNLISAIDQYIRDNTISLHVLKYWSHIANLDVVIKHFEEFLE